MATKTEKLLTVIVISALAVRKLSASEASS